MRTIGILYPGDMGHSVGRVLLEDGFTVVTTLVGRSERTRRLCASTAITVLDSMDAVVAQADAVLSIIPPTAATSVATEFAAAVRHTGHRPLFVDANAISPMAAQRVGEIIAQVDAPYLDACIVGPARDVRGRCTFYVSGPRAQVFEEQLTAVVPVCSDARHGRVHGVQEWLVPAILASVTEAKASLIVRVLHDETDAERLKRLVRQLRSAGTNILKILLGTRSDSP